MPAKGKQVGKPDYEYGGIPPLPLSPAHTASPVEAVNIYVAQPHHRLIVEIENFIHHKVTLTVEVGNPIVKNNFQKGDEGGLVVGDLKSKESNELGVAVKEVLQLEVVERGGVVLLNMAYCHLCICINYYICICYVCVFVKEMFKLDVIEHA